jgi:hypothetical protein
MSSFCLFAQQTKFVPPDGIFFRFGDSVQVYAADDFDRLWNVAFMDYGRRVYSVGWSRNGNFAYMIQYIPDTVGGHFYDFHVINLVDDVMLFEDNLSLAVYSSADEDEREKAATVVENKFREWNVLVKQYNIDGTIESPGQGTTIQKFPHKFSNWNYDLYYESQNIDGDESRNIDRECDWRLILSRKNNSTATQKIISTGAIKNSYEMHSILGYYKSPFEDRIAAIICRETWARGIGFSVFGAHLNVGFK